MGELLVYLGWMGALILLFTGIVKTGRRMARRFGLLVEGDPRARGQAAVKETATAIFRTHMAQLDRVTARRVLVELTDIWREDVAPIAVNGHSDQPVPQEARHG